MRLCVFEKSGAKRLINVMMVKVEEDTKEIEIWDYCNNYYIIKVDDERYTSSCVATLYERGYAHIEGIFLSR